MATSDTSVTALIINKISQADLNTLVSGGNVPANQMFFTPESDTSDFDYNHPVDSVYISVGSSSPAALGLSSGTWVLIKDVFLLGGGDTYTLGSTGGEATHTLTVDEIPSHRHQETVNDSPVQTWSTTFSDGGETGGWSLKTDTYDSGYKQYTMNQGGGQAHDNMPPYLVVYMWKRTA